MQIKKPFFRTESMKKLSEPEQLNEYVKVISSPIWITLIAVIVLFAGAFIWASTSVMERRIPAVVCVSDSETTVYFSSDYLGQVYPGQLLKLDGSDKEYYIEDVNYQTVSKLHSKVSGNDTIDSDWLYMAYIYTDDLEDGQYNGYIILEKKHPINYLIQ